MSGAEGARRAVAYIRLAESGPSPAPQLRAIEAWAERECVEITSWQIDVGIAGTTPIAERPGLVAAYRALRENRAGLLVAANAQEFGQDELVCWLIERAALTHGAMIHTADGSRGPTRTAADASPVSPAAAAPETSWTRGAIALASAFERVTVRARVRAAFAEKRARGERVGNVPYGYRLAADGLHIETDDAEQAVVATVLALSADGLSQRAIAARLAERGVSGRTGAPLRQTQIANILRNAS